MYVYFMVDHMMSLFIMNWYYFPSVLTDKLNMLCCDESWMYSGCSCFTV